MQLPNTIHLFKNLTSLLATAFILMQCSSANESKDTDDIRSTDALDSEISETDSSEDTETDNEMAKEESLALLVDDFEDGDGTALSGGIWYVYTDTDNSGASSLTVTRSGESIIPDGKGYESERALTISYALDPGEYEYEPYVGWGVNMGAESTPFDASAYTGIAYTYKGSAHLMLLQTFDVTDWDDYLFYQPAAEDWTSVSLPFSSFAQSGWGTPVTLDLSNIRNLGWQVKGAAGDTGSVSIDNVGFLGTPSTEERKPDLLIRDEPIVPEDEVIDTLDIENPLQELALSTLDKGYTFTNWLEAGKFEKDADDKNYNAAHVNILASHGFKAIRLPIDLDRYIVGRETYFKGETAFEIEELLFEILDNFDEWTKAEGLSLTIDYHQYDGTFDMDDPLYVDAVIRLWTGIAEHFKDNAREDLFFEIMNEPELAGDVPSVSQDDWTDFAAQIIAGIRSVDTSHVILFGDVNWNHISPLIDRAPLNDDKIIYVFHFYKPTIFVYQGAPWVDLGTVHDIPYPYSKDRWSEYSADFGFTVNTPGWCFDELHNYYQIGNKSWIRNQIVEAKRWAVENNVPIICNEFGVHPNTALEEDRLRYYTDLIDIFEELEIPWQHWFQIMDREGVIDKKMTAVLGLTTL